MIGLHRTLDIIREICARKRALFFCPWCRGNQDFSTLLSRDFTHK